jgi:hypothetical protein
MNELAKKRILQSLATLGGDIDYSEQTDSATVLVDHTVCSLLKIPEFCTLEFDHGSNSGKIDLLELESKLDQIAMDRGRCVSVCFNPTPDQLWPSPKRVSESLLCANGKIILNETRAMNQTYLVVFSRCSAVSDEKRLLLAGAAINMSSMSISTGLAPAIEHIIDSLYNRTDPGGLPPPLSKEIKKIIPAAVQFDINKKLVDFNESIRKRISRDSLRLYTFYHELYQSALKPSGRKKPDPQQLKSALDAIVAEYHKKIDDLRIKFFTSITIEPLCLLYITIPGIVASFDIFMGNKSIKKSIAWNPLSADTDKTICDCCFKPVSQSHICRELHWLCDSCWKICPSCNREFCSICKPSGCNCSGK